MRRDSFRAACAGVFLLACAACSGGGLRIVARSPAPGDSGVWVRDPVTAVFSAPLSRSTVGDATVRIETGDGVELAKSVEVSGDGLTVTLRLLEQPPLPTELRVTFTSAITDVDGSPLAPSASWSWALPAWQRLGGIATPAARRYPYPALVASRVGPVLAYLTVDSHVRVRRWDGAAWVDLGGSPQRDVDAFVGQHVITTDAEGAPIVVWTENDLRENRLFASVWDGAWSPLGDELSLGSATWPVAAQGEGDPVVAWWECEGSCSRYVKAWDGAAWVQLGGAVPSNPTGDPVLAVDGSGHPYVLNAEDDGGGPKPYVEHWDGVAWQRLGAFSTSTDATPYDRAIALDGDGRPIVLWGERADSGDVWATRAKRWDGAAWVELGGSLAVDAAVPQGQHALAVDRFGRPVASWFEYDTSGQQPVSHLYAKRWDGVDWQPLGSRVNDERAESVVPPDVAVWDDDQLLIAWTRARGDPDPDLDVIVGRFNELTWSPPADPEAGGAR
jgi:hypothetical protein